MRIAFIYLRGRSARLAELARGEVPSEFFYGAKELADAGHTIEHFEMAEQSSARTLAATLDLLRRAYLTPPKMFGHTLASAWTLAPRLNEFDCVVATVGHHAFALAACAAAGRLRTPIVAIQCGLLHHRYSAPRRAITRTLMNRMHSVFFGKAEHAPTAELLHPDPSRLSVNQFGVDPQFWSPAGEREDFVLAIGNDPRRDYATLLAAADEIGAPIQIITRLPLPEKLPANVTVLRGSWHDRAISDAEIRALYRRAACVVTPLHESLQPSGQSVTLQAMACATPAVLTRTSGLWNPDALRDGENIALVPPANPHELARTVRGVIDDRARAEQLGAAGRRHVVEHANIADFARRIGEACERAVAGR
ncbi:MAG TPA: glycosyltransferase family 4 protein [Chthoniobacteraceae bacterium]|nr:glycosyltransferase family 4 protein [Chthoniobacteraceae bacterium]